jgi:hypothetical protein
LTILSSATGEEVRVARGDGEAAHGANVAGERDFEFAAGDIPDFDHAIGGAGGEPLVAVVDGNGLDGPGVTGNNTHELPGRVPLGLLRLHLFVERERDRLGHAVGGAAA